MVIHRVSVGTSSFTKMSRFSLPQKFYEKNSNADPKIDAYFVPIARLVILKHFAEVWMWATSVLTEFVLALDILLEILKWSEVCNTNFASGWHYNLRMLPYWKNNQQQWTKKVIIKSPSIQLQKYSPFYKTQMWAFFKGFGNLKTDSTVIGIPTPFEVPPCLSVLVISLLPHKILDETNPSSGLGTYWNIHTPYSIFHLWGVLTSLRPFGCGLPSLLLPYGQAPAKGSRREVTD